jgi:hypothetical protein
MVEQWFPKDTKQSLLNRLLVPLLKSEWKSTELPPDVAGEGAGCSLRIRKIISLNSDREK